MSIIDKLYEKSSWDAFFDYKVSLGNISEDEASDLRSYIDGEEYLAAVQKIRSGEGFPPAKKTLISKSKAGRKRAVYTYAREENYLLKLVTFLLRDYDYLFSPNLYSFRMDSGVKKATRDILKIKDLNSCYVYRADISDYFNSVDIGILLPELESVLVDDGELFGFIKGLLEAPFVQYEGELIEEKRGIMAGVPLSAFLANFYLRELDAYFYERDIPYVRYSDDILVFAYGEAELKESIDKIKSFLHSKKLKINTEKETVTPPGEKWEFLGFSYYRGVIDISAVSFEKLKAKMRRKAKALYRWSGKKNVPGEFAARAFVKKFNAKLYDNPVYNELTWTRWFFPVINTSETLKAIDGYMQDCIRYIATGKRTKGRYNFRYEEIKNLGYRSLVNEYYKFKTNDGEENK